MKYPFLSDEWVAEARRIYAEAQGNGGPVPAPALLPVRVNVIVTQVPFSTSAIDAHIDTSTGRFAIDTGHVTQADVTVSMEYATARSLFVGGDVQAVMQAFLGGRIKVDGDFTKLLDPRSGIWPAMPAPGTAMAGIGAAIPAQPDLGLGGPKVLDLAKSLQEITE